MNDRVLVLNQDFSPISVCSAERAFVLIYLEKSEMIKPANGYQLRSVDKAFPMPSVIRLNRYVNIPYKGVNLNRQNIFKRDNFQCQYCGTKKDLTLDHVIPRARGGTHSWENLVTACKKCNAKKGDFSPERAGMRLTKKPTKPSYITFLRELANGQTSDWQDFLVKR